ncbi:hypothetical protein [Bradyrhizobium sp. HKCCYLS20291]|uniref:hypothetical protein n=1 Tax=Bradyrhizobium sp. HKCCYLS20291 TaxID=3420766 RepID=UPI003EBBE8A3
MSDILHTVVVARAIEAHAMASFELVAADNRSLPGLTPGSHRDARSSVRSRTPSTRS